MENNTIIASLFDDANDATRATVKIDPLDDGRLFVSVYWPQTEGEDGDHCHGQNTILPEAFKVLAALQARGYEHVAYSGGKSFGHSGGTTAFAVAKQ